MTIRLPSTYPVRDRSCHGVPAPTTSIERTCKNCGASRRALSPVKTGECGIRFIGNGWVCSHECSDAVILATAKLRENHA